MNNCRLEPKRGSRALTDPTDLRPLAARCWLPRGPRTRPRRRPRRLPGTRRRPTRIRSTRTRLVHAWKQTLRPGAAKALQKMMAIVGAPTASRDRPRATSGRRSPVVTKQRRRAHRADRSMRKIGWSRAIRRSSASAESGRPPSKKAPTSHFQRSRYARRIATLSSSGSSTAVKRSARRPEKAALALPAILTLLVELREPRVDQTRCSVA
jgi:hypothetical protein